MEPGIRTHSLSSSEAPGSYILIAANSQIAYFPVDVNMVESMTARAMTKIPNDLSVLAVYMGRPTTPCPDNHLAELFLQTVGYSNLASVLPFTNGHVRGDVVVLRFDGKGLNPFTIEAVVQTLTRILEAGMSVPFQTVPALIRPVRQMAHIQ